MRNIVQNGDPVLRQIAKPVGKEMFGGKKLTGIIEGMKEALAKSQDGVAIAAPQIGLSLRIFVVASNALEENTKNKTEIDESETAKLRLKNLVYINPEITRRSIKKIIFDEGCLSVKNIFGKIERSEKVTIHALDENGKKFSRGASRLLAEIFQHETDHLNGILFIDKATNLVKVEENKK